VAEPACADRTYITCFVSAAKNLLLAVVSMSNNVSENMLLKFLILTFIAAGLSGCCTVDRLSNRELLIRSLGANGTNYVQLFETSIEALEQHESDLLRKVNSALRGILEVSTNCPEVSARVTHIEKVAAAFYADKRTLIQELREAANPKTDSIFYYHFKSSTHQEDGWLVARGGTIKRKVNFGEGIVLPPPVD
jgi:hypothetical protein